MKRSHLIPAAAALGLHALLLFGFTSSTPARPGSADVQDRVTICLDRVTVEQLPDPPSEEDTGTSKYGAPAPHRDEPLLSVTRPDGFEIEVPAPRPQIVAASVDCIPPVIGSPDGTNVDGALSSAGWVGVGQLDFEPRPTVRASPQYPSERRRAGDEGTVVVAFVVDHSGRVQNPHVVHSDHRDFEEPALRAVSRWRFEPGLRHGRPVAFRMAVPIVFSLAAEN